MNLSATDAKNRFGQVLEQAQKRPVFIDKAGRRHSVVMSVELYDRLVAAKAPQRDAEAGGATEEGRQFYEKYKDWVDMQNELVETHGIFGEDYRVW
jgi:prevent-host-death family protein